MVNKSIILILILLLFSACASTKISVDKRDVDIVVDGVKRGKGVAYIPRTGIPRKAEIKAYRQNKEVGYRVIRRRFDGATFFAGLFTYGLGFIFVWRFPKEVHIPIKGGVDNFDKKHSIWELPPGQNRDN